MNLELSDAAKRDIKKIQDKNAKAAIIKTLDDFCEYPHHPPAEPHNILYCSAGG